MGSEDEGRLLGCIDRALETFGPDVKQAVYWRLEKEFMMKRTDIVLKPELFSNDLAHMFGLGARVVESCIIREIEREAQLQSRTRGALRGLMSGRERAGTSDDVSLAETIKEARSHMQRLGAEASTR